MPGGGPTQSPTIRGGVPNFDVPVLASGPDVLGALEDTRVPVLADIAGLETNGMNDAQKAALFIEKIKEFNRKMNIPEHLEILEKDIPTIAKRALREGNPLYPVPKIMDYDDCVSVIKRIAK